MQFSLIDVATNKPVAGYENMSQNQLIDLSKLVGKKLSIEAKVGPSIRPSSVRIILGKSVNSVENEAPYSLFGDSDGKFRTGQLPLGDMKLSAVAYSQPRAKGNVLASAEINLRISNAGVPPQGGGTETPGPETPVGDVAMEKEGIVRIEMESAVIANNNWKKKTLDGINYVVWEGDDYDHKDSVSGIPSNAKLAYQFTVTSPGTFKFFFNTHRVKLSTNVDDGSQNDVFIAIRGIQNYEKVYTNLPWGQWNVGGRSDRLVSGATVKSPPEYTFSQAGTYYLDIMPRSSYFKIDYIELKRLGVPQVQCSNGMAEGQSKTITIFNSATVPYGQTCIGQSFVVETCTGGQVVKNTIPTGKVDSCTVLPGTGGDGGSSGQVGLRQLTSTAMQAALDRALIYYGRVRLNSDGSTGTGTLNGGANDARGLGVGAVLAISSLIGDTRADSRLLENIRYILQPGREPLLNGGYNSQHEIHGLAMFVIAKNTPRIWSQLSAEEKLKITVLMKAALIANAYTSDTNSDSYGIDGDSNIYVGGNPNYRVGIVGSIIVAVSYFGTTEAENILKNYSQTSFINELKAVNARNTLSVWEFVVPANYTNGSPRGVWKKPSASKVESIVRSFDYAGAKVTEPLKLFKSINDNAYNAKIACGLNDGAGRSGGCGAMISKTDCQALPNKGLAGMIREFASGDRSSATYAYDVFKVTQSTLFAMIASNLFDKSAVSSTIELIVRGQDDFVTKIISGYFNSKEGKACTDQSTSRYTDAGYSYEVNVPAWNQILKPYLTGSVVSNPDSGGQQNVACGALAHGATESRQMFKASTVPAGQTCQSEQQTRTCTNGVLSAFTGSFTFAKCVVESAPSTGGGSVGGTESSVAAPMPAVDGKPWCYANRLNWDVIPNAHVKKNVGAKTPESSLVDFKAKYPNDFTQAGDKIYIKTGNKEYTGFKTNYGIEILASNVKLSDFVVSGGGVKVPSDIEGNAYRVKNIVLTDGEIRRTDNYTPLTSGSSGIGVLGPNWSGYRLHIHGFGDAVRTEGNNVLAYSLTRRLGPLSTDHADMVQSIRRPDKLPITNIVFFRNFFSHIQSEDEKFFPTDKRPGKMNNVFNLMAEWKAYDNIVYSSSFVASATNEDKVEFFNNCLMTDGRFGYGASKWLPGFWYNNINLRDGKIVDVYGK